MREEDCSPFSQLQVTRMRGTFWAVDGEAQGDCPFLILRSHWPQSGGRM